MQLHSRFKYGSRYPKKGELYHLGYSPYNFNEQSMKNARALLKEWIVENRDNILLFKINKLKKSFKIFNEKRNHSELLQKSIGLDELQKSNVLKKGDFILEIDKKKTMYPVLWNKEDKGIILDKTNIMRNYDKIKIFCYNNTRNIFAVLYKSN